METLEIEFVDVGEDFLAARMPVTQKVYQPEGILHGGATVALAETVGSAAVAVFNRDPGVITRGIEISANHVKSVKEGYVTGTARPIHLGRTTQLWEIKVFGTCFYNIDPLKKLLDVLRWIRLEKSVWTNSF